MAGSTKQETTDVKEVTKNAKGTVLNPWTCLAVKNEKYAKECTEVYLCGKGANQISEEFRRFPSLEVLWFNHNRLTRLDNLEANFRVQEVYIGYNRLVSLKGLLTFKFLRVLLARGNQLRNLDKQINLLGNFSFLSRLDLSENAAADEPDYQLRIVYHLPQVEDLDRKAVKPHERLKAAEVVPNLDKVTEKPQSLVKRFEPSQQYSALEKHCYTEARALRMKYKRQEEEERLARYASSADWLQLYGSGDAPKDAKDRYNSSMCNATLLSPYECSELYFFFYQRYVNEVEPQEIFKLTLDKTKEVGELMDSAYEKPKPDSWVDNGKSAAAGGSFEPPTAAMKNAKIKGRDERGKMVGKMLELEEVKEIIDALAGGDAVMLGRTLNDKCSEVQEDAVSEERGGQSAGSSRDEAQKRAFWKPLLAEGGTVSLYDFYKWVTTLKWSWEPDERLDARIQDMSKRARMARILSNHEEALVLSQMMNRMDGIKTRKRDLDMSSRNQKGEAIPRRVDVLPLITFDKTTVVDEVSGKTRVEFERSKSEFRFSECR
jgi:hypothetical protein